MMSIPITGGFYSTRRLPAGLLMLVGVGLGILALEFLITHPFSPLWWRIEFLTIAGITATIVYCGYWLARSDYKPRDLWVILGWCISGVVAGLVLASGIYVHQTVEQVAIADLPFLFEVLGLVGASVGIAFGLSRRSSVIRQRADDPSAIETNPPSFLQSVLGGDRDAFWQRWTMVELLINNSVREIPTQAFIVQLTETNAFPDDKGTVATLVTEEHLPVLIEKGVVVRTGHGTVRYVGPDSIADHLSKRE